MAGSVSQRVYPIVGMAMDCTTLRFVLRDGKKILQQACKVYDADSRPVDLEWLDVPLMDEE